MIGTIVLRGDGLVLAIAADDLDVREGEPSRWQVRLILASDGMRIEVPAVLGEHELPAFGRALEEVVAGAQTGAGLESEDGSLFLSTERDGEGHIDVSIRIVRDHATGLYSTVQTEAKRRDLADFARRALKFPH